MDRHETKLIMSSQFGWHVRRTPGIVKLYSTPVPAYGSEWSREIEGSSGIDLAYSKCHISKSGLPQRHRGHRGSLLMIQSGGAIGS